MCASSAALDRHGEDVVVREQLDRPLGAARASGRRRRSCRRARARGGSRRPSPEPGRRTPAPADTRCARGVCASSLATDPASRAPSRREPCATRPTRRSSARAGGALFPSRPPRRSSRESAPRASSPCARTSSGSDTSTTGRPCAQGNRKSSRDRSGVAARVAEQFLQRHDRSLIERGGRSLRRRVVGADRFDGVADELEPDRLLCAGRKEVDDAAADAELARTRRPDPAACSRRSASRSPRSIGEISWPGASVTDVRRRAVGRADAAAAAPAADAITSRALPGRKRVQRPRARRRDVEVRRQAAVRIDLVRREAAAPRARPRRRTEPSSAARKNRASACHPLDVGVSRDDHQHRSRARPPTPPRTSLWRRRQPGDPAGAAHPSRTGRRPSSRTARSVRELERGGTVVACVSGTNPRSATRLSHARQWPSSRSPARPARGRPGRRGPRRCRGRRSDRRASRRP